MINLTTCGVSLNDFLRGKVFCFVFILSMWRGKRSHGKMSWNDLNEVSEQTEKNYALDC